MKYIYNPITGTLDDVETPNLGEKYFASAETDALKDMMNEQFGPGTIKYGSEIPQPEMRIKYTPNLGERLNVEIFDQSEIGLILVRNLVQGSIFSKFVRYNYPIVTN